MLLLSYGGEEPMGSSKVQRQQTEYFESTIAVFGILHGDVGCTNMLWNKELGRFMFIDFERSTLFDPIRKVPDDKAQLPNPHKHSKFVVKKPNTRIHRRGTGTRKVLGELPLSYRKLNRSRAVHRHHTADDSTATPNGKNDVGAKEHEGEDRLEMPVDRAASTQ
ncbi:MAG: hypothetical protein Q9207_006468 [Kuettlingeria erythrocarpa]